jgi:HPt (histidine-containing phosphotransfer) domain-containing protein
MSLSDKIREQLLSSFRAELAEHVQTMTDGLLALEQGRVEGEQRQSTLENVFRAAHSLKGAARAVDITVIEQLAHALESVLDAMQRQAIELTPELFTACYQALDAIQTARPRPRPRPSRRWPTWNRSALTSRSPRRRRRPTSRPGLSCRRPLRKLKKPHRPRPLLSALPLAVMRPSASASASWTP